VKWLQSPVVIMMTVAPGAGTALKKKLLYPALSIELPTDILNHFRIQVAVSLLKPLCGRAAYAAVSMKLWDKT
jgi:hypothetical protein